MIPRPAIPFPMMQLHMHSKLHDLLAISASAIVGWASFHVVEGVLKILILIATLSFIVLGCIMRYKRIKRAEIEVEEED